MLLVSIRFTIGSFLLEKAWMGLLAVRYMHVTEVDVCVSIGGDEIVAMCRLLKSCAWLAMCACRCRDCDESFVTDLILPVL